MGVISTGQVTIVDYQDVVVTDSQPENPLDGTLWLDTSTEPNELKVFKTDEGWIKAAPTTADEVGAVPVENIIATINASGEQVKILGSKIDITGAVTFNSLDSSLQTMVDNGDSAKSIVDGWKMAGKTTIDGGKIEADTISVAALKAGNIDADKISISNDKVTIDSSGVTVTDADFVIEDAKTGTLSSAVPKTNLISDHSFENIPPNFSSSVLSNYYYDVDTTKMRDATVGDGTKNKWIRIGVPKVAVSSVTGDVIPPERILFGVQSILVNSDNYVYQEISAVPNKTYTLSFHATKPLNLVSGVPKVEIAFIGDSLERDTRISQTFPVPDTSDIGESRRYSYTFTVPSSMSAYSEVSMKIYIESTNSDWVEVDGVQCVLGTVAAPYEAENSVWAMLRGSYKAYNYYAAEVNADDIYSPYIHNVAAIYGQYNRSEIVKDHMNGNITLSAQGGDLFLGYYNTNYVQANKELRMNAGGRVTSGALVVANGNVDASNGIVLGGAFKFTKTSAPPTSGDGVLWYGNGYNGLGLYMYRTSGWVQVK